MSMGKELLSLFQDNTLLSVAVIMALGYVLGSFHICGISLGTAGILIVALVFGHFGVEVPSIIQNLGLACFVTAVGYIAGPNFGKIFRGNAKKYAALGIAIIASGALSCLVIKFFTGLSNDLALGLMAGALTTTPGLAAAIEATKSDVVSLGYGIAYPFGVISVVLFVQLMPKFLHADMEQEKKTYIAVTDIGRRKSMVKMISCDSRGFFGFSAAIAFGLLIGKITIPLPGSVGFSLGTSGGTLFMGLLCGSIGRVGKLDISVKNEVLVSMREFGLGMFLLGAGTHAGAGFIEIITQYGTQLFLYGVLMSVVPIAVGYVLARYVFKMNLLDTLGSICGGMTSTPALGMLIQVAQTDDVASAYAATYPIALAMIVILTQIIGVML